MPVYESYCDDCTRIKEWYAKHFVDIHENPPCEQCGGPTKRLLSRFGVVFTGALSKKYNDPKVEKYDQEGHWAYRVKSSVSGHPEPVYIDSFQAQREFCKAEGLANPKDLPNMEADSDGRFRSNAGVGMPGAWV